MKKILFVVFIVAGLFSGLYLKQGISKVPESAGKINSLPVVTAVRKTPGIPAKLSIEKIGLRDVTIERVGLDEKGRMDVPKKEGDVAWFELGYKPGLEGNAVLAGHFDKSSGAPAVFYNLDKLVSGDLVTLTDDEGRVTSFRVTDKRLFPSDNFPVKLIFGKSEKKMLNLITCNGVWDPVAKNYSKRLVVTTELTE